MPWRPSYTKAAASAALAASSSWSEALRRLGLGGHGKNIATLRRWSERWDLDTAHLKLYRPPLRPRFTQAEARAAIADSYSWSAALRRLGYCPTGANPKTLKKWAKAWNISTDHFDPHRARPHRRIAIPIEDVLVERSTYSRGKLKRRLFEEGLKQRRCEMCGQGELWQGRAMSLILDHINGVRDDNRFQNLRVVCPNCAATLDTHCGRKSRIIREPRRCPRCRKEFQPKRPDHRYCSPACGSRWDRTGLRRPGGTGVPRPESRRVVRPPYEQLLREIEETSYLAVGRRYGVSDNAVRKWVRWYENEAAREQAEEAEPAPSDEVPDSLDEAA